MSSSSSQRHDDFRRFRLHYLIVHVAIMLADGLQGTHLYALYESYGYSVANLYSLGFLTGALTSPVIGPVVDYIGRRKSAMIYCILEMMINTLELFDSLPGLILSRMIGGVTTNLLFSVFESWLITEHKRRQFSEEKLEIVLRDSVVSSNMSAIVSGMLAHMLALQFGNTGPFRGAVFSTGVALCLVARWEENYGGKIQDHGSVISGDNKAQEVGIVYYMVEAFKSVVSNESIRRIGLIQGLTEGALQTFVFLWSPALTHFAKVNPETCASAPWGIETITLDSNGEKSSQCVPAYGLIFGAYMAAGVLGGLSEPVIRSYVTQIFGKGLIHIESNASICEIERTESVDLYSYPSKCHPCARTPSYTPTEISIDHDPTPSELSSDQEDICDAYFLDHVKDEQEKLQTSEFLSHSTSAEQQDEELIKRGESISIAMETTNTPISEFEAANDTLIENDTSEGDIERPPGTEIFVACVFLICSFLLAVPMLVKDFANAYSLCLLAFLAYEFMVGLYLPLDGLIRSIYIPTESICSIHTMLRVLVNIAVAIGVISTNYVDITSAFAGCSFAMVIAGTLMLSLRQDAKARRSWKIKEE